MLMVQNQGFKQMFYNQQFSVKIYCWGNLFHFLLYLIPLIKPLTLKNASMTVQQYRNAITTLLNGTTNKDLLRLWLEHMEWDLAHENEVTMVSIRSSETGSGYPESNVPYNHNNVFSIKNVVIIRN